MNFDVITLNAVCDEIRTRALGGRVQRVVAPEPDQIGFEVYAQRATHHLLLQAGAQRARMHFVLDRLPAGRQPASPLLLLLRKWVRGGRLTGVAQLPLERVVTLTVETRGPDGAPERHDVIMEIIGRQTNIILVDAQGLIRDSLRRIAGREGRRRIQPRAPYRPPDPVSQAAVAEVAPADIRAVAEAAPRPAWQVLVRAIAAVSPTLAREALARAGVESDRPGADVHDWSPVLEAMRSLFDAASRAEWQPTTVAGPEGGWQAFAPYRLTHLDLPSQPHPTISAALVAYYAESRPARPANPLAGELQAAIAQAIVRVERRCQSLRSALGQASEADRLRLAGETLLAHAHAIEPGATVFEAPDQRIDLDPLKTAVANSQVYFERYRDRQRAAQRVPRLIRRAELELASLRQAADDLARADAPHVIRALRRELQAAGVLPSRRKPATAEPGRSTWRLQGRLLLAGRTAAENHRVTFQDAAPDDLWLHARGLPGAHVVVRDPGPTPSDDLVQAAAALAAYHSAGRHDSAVEVDVTRRRQVRAIRGAGPGQVTYRGERTVRVAPRPPSAVVDAPDPEAGPPD